MWSRRRKYAAGEHWEATTGKGYSPRQHKGWSPALCARAKELQFRSSAVGTAAAAGWTAGRKTRVQALETRTHTQNTFFHRSPTAARPQCIKISANKEKGPSSLCHHTVIRSHEKGLNSHMLFVGTNSQKPCPQALNMPESLEDEGQKKKKSDSSQKGTQISPSRSWHRSRHAR